jgi:hypothetical protein
MDEIIIKRMAYSPEDKPEEVVYTVKIAEMIAGNDIYDYNYYITEEDDYYQPKIGDNNFTMTTTKQNTYVSS